MIGFRQSPFFHQRVSRNIKEACWWIATRVADFVRAAFASPLQLSGLLIIFISLLPLIYLFWRAREVIHARGLSDLLSPYNLQIVANSLVLTASVAMSAALISLPLAWLTTRSDLYHRRLWLVLVILPMCIPSYLGAVTLNRAFGARGMLQSLLEPLGVERLPGLYGFFGAWLCLTLFTYPYILLPLRAALLNSDPALEEAARTLGNNRWHSFRKITLPMLRPALAIGMLLSALYTLSDFGVVSVMQFSAFTRAIYLQYTLPFTGRSNAALLSLVLVAITLLLLLLERRIASRQRHFLSTSNTRRTPRLVRLGIWQTPASLFCLLLSCFGVFTPMLVLLSWLTRQKPDYALPFNLSTLTVNTVGVAALTAFVVAIAAFPLGYLTSRSPSPLNRALARIAYIPNALPGIIIALALVFFATRQFPALYQTLPLLILAYGIRFLPLSFGPTSSAFSSISPRYEEAARDLGLRPTSTVWQITIPLARAEILAGMAIVFLNVVKELPTTLLLAPTGFQTFATYIWNSYEDAIYSQIAQPGLILIILSGLSLLLIFPREKTRWRSSPFNSETT